MLTRTCIRVLNSILVHRAPVRHQNRLTSKLESVRWCATDTAQKSNTQLVNSDGATSSSATASFDDGISEMVARSASRTPSSVVFKQDNVTLDELTVALQQQNVASMSFSRVRDVLKQLAAVATKHPEQAQQIEQLFISSVNDDNVSVLERLTELLNDQAAMLSVSGFISLYSSLMKIGCPRLSDSTFVLLRSRLLSSAATSVASEHWPQAHLAMQFIVQHEKHLMRENDSHAQAFHEAFAKIVEFQIRQFLNSQLTEEVHPHPDTNPFLLSWLSNADVFQFLCNTDLLSTVCEQQMQHINSPTKLVTVLNLMTAHRHRDLRVFKCVAQQMAHLSSTTTAPLLPLPEVFRALQAMNTLNHIQPQLLDLLKTDLIFALDSLTCWHTFSYMTYLCARLRYSNEQLMDAMDRWIQRTITDNPSFLSSLNEDERISRATDVAHVFINLSRLNYQPNKSFIDLIKTDILPHCVDAHMTLDIVWALALFTQAPASFQHIAHIFDTEFYEPLVNAKERLFKAYASSVSMKLKLMNITSAFRAMYPSELNTLPLVTAIDDGSFFDTAEQRVASYLKYSSKQRARVIPDLLNNVVPETDDHVQMGVVTKESVFVDGLVVLDNDGKLVPIGEWSTDSQRTAIVATQYQHFTLDPDPDQPRKTNSLVGVAQMGCDLLSRNGYRVALITDSQVAECHKSADKVDCFLKLLRQES